MGKGERPEHTAPPEIFYNDDEARKYTSNSRMIAIQVRVLWDGRGGDGEAAQLAGAARRVAQGKRRGWLVPPGEWHRAS